MIDIQYFGKRGKGRKSGAACWAGKAEGFAKK
jgi:hypothetical protein